MRDIDEVRVGLRGRMVRHPRPQPWTQQLIRLCRLHIRKRYAKVLVGLCIEPIQPGLIHLLAIRGRNSNQEIKKLRRSRLYCSWIVFRWRQQDFTQSP